MNLTAKLELGTVQWGLRYGIANRSGRPGIEEVGQILSRATVAGVRNLDTAHNYGDAELVLGQLKETAQAFRIFTKTAPIQADRISEADVRNVSDAFDLSTIRLDGQSIAGLMVHHASDLLAPGGERLWAWMVELKSSGRVGRIGVSVYHPEQLLRLLELFPLEFVQFGYNIYDQRFRAEGLLREMKKAGIETHARSPFLQGLLLIPAAELPARFESIRRHQAALHSRLAEERRTPLDAALTFSLAEPDIDYVVTGCETLAQLDTLLAIAARGSQAPQGVEAFAVESRWIIDPSRWQA